MIIYQNKRNKRALIQSVVVFLIVLSLIIGVYAAFEHFAYQPPSKIKSDVQADPIINQVEKQAVQQTSLEKNLMLYETDDRLMEHSFQPGTVPAAAIVGTLVDIKLMRENAEDLIVISKAAIVQRSENTLAFYLNLQEQEYLKEAAVGGNLILTVYANGNQPASVVDYFPNFKRASKIITADGIKR